METRKDVKLSPPAAVWNIAEQLIGRGHSVYIVGGWVRDSLLGREPCDCDLAVSASPDEVLSCLTGWRTFETGRKHGTITVLADGRPVEVTTFRRDGEYTDARRPDRVYFTDSILEDLYRRDFTINAMAYHPREGLFDPAGGLSDLKRGILRAVGDPRRRFREDALRILRAVRFCAVLGFEMQPKTRLAMMEAADGLRLLSRERIQKELVIIFRGAYMTRTLFSCKPIWQELFPFYQEEKRYADLVDCLLSVEPDFLTRLCLFLQPLPPGERSRLLQSLRFPSKTIADASLLLEKVKTPCPDKVSFAKLYGVLGEKKTRSFLAVGQTVGGWNATTKENYLKWLEEITKKHLCCSRKELAVNGEDLLSLGTSEGEEVGIVLEQLLRRVIEGRLPNQRDALLAAARELVR